MKTPINKRVSGSFRDPSGFTFFRDGLIYRQVNLAYKAHYDHLIGSGLHRALAEAELIIPFAEVEIVPPEAGTAYKIIQPETIDFISYPYEWCFSQLKGAALVTLKVQKMAFQFGMSLKDASAYNVQFRKGKPVFIDTLSFEKYREGQPWVAYTQFCQHFLAPLALMSYRDIRLGKLLSIYLDGIPLDLASSLLPFGTRFNFSTLSHIHLHAKSQKYFANKSVNTGSHRMGRLAFLSLIDNLESAVSKLKWRVRGTEWADYYYDTNYSQTAFQDKKRIVAEFLEKANPGSVWDIGANVGIFSRLASDRGTRTISFDIDPGAVEKNYLECVAKGERNILPLILDLTNPSPGIGWENDERMSLLQRGPADTVLALALVHHLAISNNVPMDRIAGFLGKICNSLIIEFVPKSDGQVQKLLATREDIYPDYTETGFASAFAKCFAMRESVRIAECERTLYLMERQ